MTPRLSSRTVLKSLLPPPSTYSWPRSLRYPRCQDFTFVNLFSPTFFFRREFSSIINSSSKYVHTFPRPIIIFTPPMQSSTSFWTGPTLSTRFKATHWFPHDMIVRDTRRDGRTEKPQGNNSAYRRYWLVLGAPSHVTQYLCCMDALFNMAEDHEVRAFLMDTRWHAHEDHN